MVNVIKINVDLYIGKQPKHFVLCTQTPTQTTEGAPTTTTAIALVQMDALKLRDELNEWLGGQHTEGETMSNPNDAQDAVDAINDSLGTDYEVLDTSDE